jgi:hypothetical protein
MDHSGALWHSTPQSAVIVDQKWPFRLPTPDSRLKPQTSNLIRIANLHAALEALHLQTFSLEPKFHSFEEWYRNALAAIHELDEQMPALYFPAQDSRQWSSASEEFQDLLESSDDTPYKRAPEPKKPQKPRSPQPQIPQPRAILVPPLSAYATPCLCPTPPILCLLRPVMPTIHQIMLPRAKLPPIVQLELLIRVSLQFAVQLFQFHQRSIATTAQKSL